MDGARFDISIEAQNIGVDSSAAELNTLVERIQQSSTVATKFDTAVAAASKRLAEAAAAATSAASALAAGEARYKELESAANNAAKQVEKAAAAGKDTTALQAAASAATEKLKEQAKAVDELRTKSLTATAAQTKLTGTLKELESQVKKDQAPAQSLNKSMLGISSGAMAAAAGVAIAAAAVAVAAFGFAAFAVSANPDAMKRLGTAAEKLKKSFTALFTGLKLDKFIAALEDIMSMFDEGTSSAEGLKTLFETILQPIFDGAAKAGPFVKEMFKGMIYGALQVVIAVLTLRNAIFKSFSPETRAAIKKFIDDNVTLQNAFKVGTAIVITLAIALGLLAAALVIAALAGIAIMLPLIAVVALVVAAFMYWDKIVAKVKETFTSWVTSAKTAASDLITGLVDGIKNGATKVYNALKDLALGGIKSFTSALGIKSPSTVFALHGGHTTAGYVEGIEEGAPKVESALESMVSPPGVSASVGAAPGGAGGSRAGAAGGGGRPINIEQLIVGDSPVAQSNLALVKQMLIELAEGAAITIGGGEAPAT